MIPFELVSGNSILLQNRLYGLFILLLQPHFTMRRYILNQNIFGEINFIPGKVVFDTYNEINTYNNYIYFVINIIGNVCIFIPIGFFISVLWRNISVKKIVLIALFMSLCIELLQLPQARGTDIDDLWLNMLGALIGYLIYILLSKAPSIQNIFYKFRVKQ